jgi:tetratricopeptide (TPR) repeat protein
MENKICVYAICKDEIKFVDKWLESMSEADYIVVLDTGSTDGTYEKLKADPRVTKVKKKIITPWRFDVARNESMKLVPDDANILVCTDFDEVFEKGWGNLLRKVWTEKIDRGLYTYIWNHNSLGEPLDSFMYDKIHNRKFTWKYPVHEVLWPLEGENYEQTSINFENKIILHHYQDKEKSRSSYFDLLKLAVEENPEDTHVRFLLAREYIIRQDLDNGIKELLETLKMPDIDNPRKRLVLLACLLHLALCYQALENYDEAIWYCQEFIKEDHTYREPYLIMAEMYNIMGMFTLAESCVKAALEYGTHKYDWVEKANTWLGWSNDVLSVSEFNLGKIDEAMKNLEIALSHEPNDARLLKNYNACLKEKLKENEEKLNNLLN